MKQGYVFKLGLMSFILLIVTACGSKNKQGKELLTAVEEIVDPYANVVDMGFASEDGKPLYWAKGNLIAKADGTVEIASAPEYIAVDRYYSDGVKEWDLFGWADTTGKKMSKNDMDYPSPKEISGNPDYDIATKLGGKWRMPTYNELKRLFSYENTQREVTTINGVSGLRLTSKINGNFIFLPAAGSREGKKIKSVGESGFYLSGTKDPKYGFAICGIQISGESVYAVDYWFQSIGRSIRPVTE